MRLLRLAQQRKAKTGSAATVLPYKFQGAQQVRAEEAAGIEGDRQGKTLPPIRELPEPWRSNACYQRSRILANRLQQGRPLRNWEIPLIEGVAKRLGRMTPEELSAQGKRMFHMRGGYALYSSANGYKRMPAMRREVVRKQDLSVWLAQGKGSETASTDDSFNFFGRHDLQQFDLWQSSQRRAAKLVESSPVAL